MDLTATFTHTYITDTEPTVITPKVKTRATRQGATITTISGLTALLADQINAITDEGQRLHALEALRGAEIIISDTADETKAEGSYGPSYWRDYGRLIAEYQGAPQLPVAAVLDLAEALRAQLATEANA